MFLWTCNRRCRMRTASYLGAHAHLWRRWCCAWWWRCLSVPAAPFKLRISERTVRKIHALKETIMRSAPLWPLSLCVCESWALRLDRTFSRTGYQPIAYARNVQLNRNALSLHLQLDSDSFPALFLFYLIFTTDLSTIRVQGCRLFFYFFHELGHCACGANAMMVILWASQSACLTFPSTLADMCGVRCACT